MHSGEKYVLKKFFNVGRGSGAITLQENNDNLEAEVKHLHYGQWMINAFYEWMNKRHVQVYKGLTFRLILCVYGYGAEHLHIDTVFSKGYLAHEIILDGQCSSVASGS